MSAGVLKIGGLWKEIKTTQVKLVWKETDAQHGVKPWASPAALWVVSWCCMGAVEKVGVGGAVLISFCLCLLVCERQREMGGETRDSEGFM